MANKKSDKPLVRNTIIGCVLAIAIFHFAWYKQLALNYHNAFFGIVDLLLLAFFGLMSAAAYKNADDPNKEWLRWVIVLTAVASCAWAGGWAAYVNEQVL